MKIKRSITTSILAALLSTAALADQQRTFGFTGRVDAFNRSGGMLVVEDSVFHIDESTLVHKRRGGKGTLSDIRPGSRIGFYPGSDASSPIDEIWILPSNWKAKPGYAVKQDQ